MSNNLKAALSSFSASLSAMEAEKAAAHKAHLAKEGACTDGVGVEASAALDASSAASILGMSALVSETAFIGVAYGTATITPDDAAAELAEVDALLAKFEAAREELDKARAALDTAFDAERTRALIVRAALSGYVGDNNGAKK